MRHYLGVNITHLEDGRLLLYQEVKINNIVKKIELGGSKPTYTPTSLGYYNTDPESKLLSYSVKYSKALEALL